MHIATFLEARDAIEHFLQTHTPERINDAPRLAHMQQLLAFLGDPQDTFKTIHIAGTSGKTSTAYYAAALLHHAGKKVGLTVSPHTVEINDRVQIANEPLSERDFCTELGMFLDTLQTCAIRPTYFEFMVAFAFWEFARQKVDYAVVEVGIGGLLDSTNVITRPDKVAVITDIGFDHMGLLGDTLPEIAAQKAGIIQHRNAVFMYRQAPDVMQAVRARAVAKQADWYILTEDDVLQNPELPAFQRRNAGLARAAIQYIAARDGFALTGQTLTQAVLKKIPGRMEFGSFNGKTVILDGAHNAQKIAALAASVRDQCVGRRIAGIVAIVDNPEAQNRANEMLTSMSKLCDELVVTQFSGPNDGPYHGVPVGDLAQAAQQLGIDVHPIVNPVHALKYTTDSDADIVVVAGSFYVLNHIRPLCV